MRVLAINQYYAPDHAATSQLLTELCEDLSVHGDRVTVVASRGRYFGGDKLPAFEEIRGVRVVRPWATSFGKAAIAGRLADYLSFWGTALAGAAREARPDVMLVVTAPPMIATGALAVARARSVPLVMWAQDVYPDIAVAFGVLSKDGVASRGLAALMRATYRAARRVVVLSNGMRDRLVGQGASIERVRVVPNWADGRAIRPLAHDANPFRRKWGLEDRFVAMYSGNLGVGHDFATFVGAARLLAGRCPRALFLFIGDGSRRKEAEALARGLPNVTFMDYQPYGALGASLSAADIHLISLRDGLEDIIVPSKLYGALAAGSPIVFVGPEHAEPARLIREHDLGWEGRLGDAEGLASAIEAAARSPADCRERGARARRLFETQFDRPIATGNWRRVLAEASE